MKTKIALAAFVSMMICNASAQTEAETAQKAEAYYKQGRAAEVAGDPDKAVQAYRAALQLNPKHANAQFRLGEVKANAESIRLGAVKARIEEVRIPTYRIENATIHEALALLGQAVDKHSEGKVAPNFVVHDPQKKLEASKLTLELKNVPVKAILQYLTTQTNTKIRYDEYAVVISAR